MQLHTIRLPKDRENYTISSTILILFLCNSSRVPKINKRSTYLSTTASKFFYFSSKTEVSPDTLPSNLLTSLRNSSRVSYKSVIFERNYEHLDLQLTENKGDLHLHLNRIVCT
jgi:hypothetical protein